MLALSLTCTTSYVYLCGLTVAACTMFVAACAVGTVFADVNVSYVRYIACANNLWSSIGMT